MRGSEVIDKSTIANFERDGAVVLRNVFSPWVESLRLAIDEVLLRPSPLARTYFPTDGTSVFFQDMCNWDRVSSIRNPISRSEHRSDPNEISNSSVILRSCAREGAGHHDDNTLASRCTRVVCSWKAKC
jgi:hypothetical protein